MKITREICEEIVQKFYEDISSKSKEALKKLPSKTLIRARDNAFKKGKEAFSQYGALNTVVFTNDTRKVPSLSPEELALHRSHDKKALDSANKFDNTAAFIRREALIPAIDREYNDNRSVKGD